jgi:trafficking protein particle complex subunit 11
MIVLDDERSAGFIKGVSFGVLASGAHILKTLYLVNTRAAGNRMVDISVQSRSTSSEATDDDLETLDVTEILQTLLVPTVNPIEISHGVTHTRSTGEWLGLADLRTFDTDFWDDRCGGEALIDSKMICVGPSEIEIESIRLEREVRVSSQQSC